MIAALAFLAGHMLGILACQPPLLAWSAAAATLSIAAFARASGSRALRIAAVMLLGFALASVATRTWLEHRVAAHADGERLLVEGEIVSVPMRRGDEVSFDALVRVIAPRDQASAPTRKFRVSWRKAPTTVFAHARWRWLVRIAVQPARASVIDLERSWLRDRVHAQARVLPSSLNQAVALAPASVNGMRERVARAVARHVADRDAGALITALAVGITHDVTREQWRIFNATGTTHLIAISGLHVTLFAACAFVITRRLWRWLPERWTPFGREPFALVIGVSASLMYAVLAGFSVPTQRTVAMLAAFAAARIARRVVPWTQTLALALATVLLTDALAPLSSGFWLSFVAVGAILMALGGRPLRPPAWRSVLTAQWVVLCALLPLSIAVFDSVSLAAVVVNAAAIPCVSFVFVPLVLLATVTELAWPVMGAPLWHVAESLYLWAWPWLAAAADWPVALWRVTPSPWWYALALAALCAAFAPWPLALRLTSAVAVLPLLSPSSDALRDGEAHIELLSAGQGLAALITTRRHAILYDTGDAWGSRGERIESLVLPRLLAGEQRRLSLVIVPRVTRDRAAGLGRLVASMAVTAVRGGGPWPGATFDYRPCVDGDVAILDGVRFEQWVASDAEERSYCALRVVTAGAAAMLAGDFNVEAEAAAVSRARAASRPLTSSIALVPRRGSSSGSSQLWVDALEARIAIVTGPPAEHATSPRATVIERWMRGGARIIETGASGVVEIGMGKTPSATVITNSGAGYPFLWRLKR